MNQNILETILVEKRKEVVQAAASKPLSELQRIAAACAPCLGFCRQLASGAAPAIIAEIKRASPSKGIIRPDLDPVKTAESFQRAGARCLSVLTDEKFFQGSLQFLADIRAAVPQMPLLRKDFICHPYQVWQTRATGADALLLIVAALKDEDLELLLHESRTAGLDILIEVHTEEELSRLFSLLRKNLQLQPNIVVGINNRDLKTFAVDLEITKRLIAWVHAHAPEFSDAVFVSESGILSCSDLQRVSDAGAKAFLLGEYLVKTGEPGQNLQRLIAEFQS